MLGFAYFTNKTRKLAWILLIAYSFFLTACTSLEPPSNINNICHIFKQYPKWHKSAKKVARRWHVPVAVQMAIIYQESRFNAQAKPPRRKILWVIPWTRPSSAYGYSQALDSTWDLYRKKRGWFFSARDRFADADDFIGWYANQAYIRAGISRDDAYSIYLAYHEGIGGYQRKTYLAKPWLMKVARKVQRLSIIYQQQLENCH